MGGKPRDYTKGLPIAFESITVAGVHGFTDHLLAVVAERWMPEVMSETGRLDHVGIKASPRCGLILAVPEQPLGKSAADLRDFQGVRQAVMEDVPLASRRHLGDPAEATELRRIQDSVAIPLKRFSGITGT